MRARAARPSAATVFAAACLLLAGMAPLRAGAPVAPVGEPTALGVLRDPEFGVRTRQPGLQRRVEMYQWRKAGGGYARVWSEEPIAADGHDPQHANPGAFPIRTRYWIARRVILDGRPLQEDVLKEFGVWRGFRPGFDALPGNLAATFQPEGDGLSSAENPLDPQIGDLRIAWRELVLPPLAGKVALENGVWVPAAAVRSAATAGGEGAGTVAAAGAARNRAWLFAGLGALAAMVVALLLLLRKR